MTVRHMTTGPPDERLATLNDLTVITASVQRIERRIRLGERLADTELTRCTQAIDAAARRICDRL